MYKAYLLYMIYSWLFMDIPFFISTTIIAFCFGIKIGFGTSDACNEAGYE